MYNETLGPRNPEGGIVNFLPQALTRAISAPGVGMRPASVLGLVLLQGTQLADKLVFDRSAGVFFEDPEIGFKLYGSVYGVLDLLNDTYHGEENFVGMQFGNWLLVASKLGDYTLIAVCQATASYDLVKAWLQGLAQVLLAGV
jgi:hypothetical protein